MTSRATGAARRACGGDVASLSVTLVIGKALPNAHVTARYVAPTVNRLAPFDPSR